jgi:hypothetical protein
VRRLPETGVAIEEKGEAYLPPSHCDLPEEGRGSGERRREFHCGAGARVRPHSASAQSGHFVGTPTCEGSLWRAIIVPLAATVLLAILGEFVRLCGSGLFARSAPLALHHSANLSKSKNCLLDMSSHEDFIEARSIKPQPRLSSPGMLSEN